jgi:hypothetical protein
MLPQLATPIFPPFWQWAHASSVRKHARKQAGDAPRHNVSVHARAREREGTYTVGKETWALGTKASDIGAAELLARVLLPALGPMLAESSRVPRCGE